MQCTACGNNIQPGASSCSGCGAAICMHCGRVIRRNSALCPSCGKKLDPTLYSSSESGGQKTMTVIPVQPATDQKAGYEYAATRIDLGDGPSARPADGSGLTAGFVLSGRYRIERELGRGGMGIVCLAHDLSLDHDVAIKLLPPELAHDDRALRDLKREAKAAMMLSHPNIIRLHNFEETKDFAFLIMEYIQGETIASLLSRFERLPQDQACNFAAQICRGLQYAHSQKVIHRDIKPANVMIHKTSDIKIADFGIARIVHDSMTRMTRVATSGTLVYMAPEVLQGESSGVRSDLYSFGILFYEMLAGRPPFVTGDITYQHINVKPKPIASVPDHINRIILTCLEKDPSSRWTNAGEIADVLERKKELTSPTPQPTQAVNDADPESRRKRREIEPIVKALRTEGTCYLEQGKYQLAISRFEEALKLSPSEPEFSQLVDLARRRQAAEEETAKKQQADRVRTLTENGHQAFIAKDYAQAISKWEDAFRIVPTAELEAIIRNARQRIAEEEQRKVQEGRRGTEAQQRLAELEAKGKREDERRRQEELHAAEKRCAEEKQRLAEAQRWAIEEARPQKEERKDEKRKEEERRRKNSRAAIAMLLVAGAAIVIWYLFSRGGSENGRSLPGTTTQQEHTLTQQPPDQKNAAPSTKVGGTTNPPVSANEGAKAVPQEDLALKAELTLWDSIKSRSDPGVFQDYLSRYPSGRFAESARSKLKATAAANLKQQIRNRIGARDWETAGAKVDELLKLVPNDTEALAWRKQVDSENENERTASNRLAAISALKEQVRKNIAERDWKNASAKIEELLKLSPNDAETLSWQGQVDKETENVRAASNRLAAIIALKQQVRDDINGRDWKNAGAKVEELLKLSPNDTEVLSWRRQVEDEIANEQITAKRASLINSIGIEFIPIPDGRFLMGCSPSDRQCGIDENPRHLVRITRSFQLGKYEVTQGQWLKVMGSNPSAFKGDDRLPVEHVSWDDVQAFIAKLNALNDGYRYRLPTEAEFEYAARGGTTEAYYGSLDAIGWYDKNSGGKTHPVGQKQPNAFGLYDIIGNVWEWCSDFYSGSYYDSSPMLDPKGPSSSRYRVLRGGSWDGSSKGARVSYRSRPGFGFGGSYIGVRVCREPL